MRLPTFPPHGYIGKREPSPIRELYRVSKEHEASFDYAFIAEKGDKISVGKEDNEMPGWLWCKNSTGLEAWIPNTHIDIDGKTAIFNQPYNSVELNAKAGEVVQYLGESLGWTECFNKEWKYGWIPSSKVEICR